MRKWIAVAALALGGCAAQQIPYVPHTGVPNAKGVIEQVLMEQERARRPEYVTTNNEYVEYGQGTSSKAPNFVGTSRSKHNVTRLYYQSVAESKLFTKRGRYIVQFRNAQGVLLAMVVSSNPDAARHLIDAVETMKDR